METLDEFGVTYRPADEGVIVVAVYGALDIATTPRLERVLQALHAGAKVRVDLAAVSFLDASALTVLADAHARASSAGGRFELTSLTPFARKILAITELEHLLGPDRGEAPPLRPPSQVLPLSRSTTRPTGDVVR